jgi:hypothetical protein
MLKTNISYHIRRKIGQKIAGLVNRPIEDTLKFSLGQAHLRQIRFHYPQVKSLHEVDFGIFSQYGEDGILDYLLQRAGISKPRFFEIGTEDYSESNTRFLYQDSNTFGVIVDAMTDYEARVYKVLEGYRYKGEILPLQTFVTLDNILELYGQALKYGELDLFSLDIDGVDYWILKELPNRFAKIVVLEYNPYLGSKLEVTVPYAADFYRYNYHQTGLAFSASLAAMITLMREKGFAFAGTNLNNHNAFFIQEKLVSCLSFPPPDTCDLTPFTVNYTREPRDAYGNLSYVAAKDRLQAIADVPFVDLKHPEKTSLPLRNCTGFEETTNPTITISTQLWNENK